MTNHDRPNLVYKILTASQWSSWLTEQPTSLPNSPETTAKIFKGAGIDLRDGYIHLSSSTQSAQTYAKYFAPKIVEQAEGCGDGQSLDRHGEDLVVVEVDLRSVVGRVQWDEVKGRGEAFAHIYEGGIPLIEGDEKLSAVKRIWKGKEVGSQLFERLEAEST